MSRACFSVLVALGVISAIVVREERLYRDAMEVAQRSIFDAHAALGRRPRFGFWHSDGGLLVLSAAVFVAAGSVPLLVFWFLGYL